MDKGDIEIIKQAIKDIERWKGMAYQEGDEVGSAVELIKKIINKQKQNNNGE